MICCICCPVIDFQPARENRGPKLDRRTSFNSSFRLQYYKVGNGILPVTGNAIENNASSLKKQKAITGRRHSHSSTNSSDSTSQGMKNYKISNSNFADFFD